MSPRRFPSAAAINKFPASRSHGLSPLSAVDLEQDEQDDLGSGLAVQISRFWPDGKSLGAKQYEGRFTGMVERDSQSWRASATVLEERSLQKRRRQDRLHIVFHQFHTLFPISAMRGRERMTRLL